MYTVVTQLLQPDFKEIRIHDPHVPTAATLKAGLFAHVTIAFFIEMPQSSRNPLLPRGRDCVTMTMEASRRNKGMNAHIPYEKFTYCTANVNETFHDIIQLNI